MHGLTWLSARLVLHLYRDAGCLARIAVVQESCSWRLQARLCEWRLHGSNCWLSLSRGALHEGPVIKASMAYLARLPRLLLYRKLAARRRQQGGGEEIASKRVT